MVSHLMLSNVTDEKEPSSLSSRVVSDILRDELEYKGVIMTDAMNIEKRSQITIVPEKQQ